MNGPIITPAALAGLDDIWFYIAQDNPKAADRVVDLIYEAITHLGRYPDSGHTHE